MNRVADNEYISSSLGISLPSKVLFEFSSSSHSSIYCVRWTWSLLSYGRWVREQLFITSSISKRRLLIMRVSTALITRWPPMSRYDSDRRLTSGLLIKNPASHCLFSDLFPAQALPSLFSLSLSPPLSYTPTSAWLALVTMMALKERHEQPAGNLSIIYGTVGEPRTQRGAAYTGHRTRCVLWVCPRQQTPH